MGRFFLCCTFARICVVISCACLILICLDHREAARAGDEVRGHGGVPSGRHGSDVLRRPRDRLRLHFPGARVAKGMHHRGTACLCLDIRVYFHLRQCGRAFSACIRTVLALGVSSCLSSGQGSSKGWVSVLPLRRMTVSPPETR